MPLRVASDRRARGRRFGARRRLGYRKHSTHRTRCARAVREVACRDSLCRVELDHASESACGSFAEHTLLRARGPLWTGEVFHHCEEPRSPRTGQERGLPGSGWPHALVRRRLTRLAASFVAREHRGVPSGDRGPACWRDGRRSRIDQRSNRPALKRCASAADGRSGCESPGHTRSAETPPRSVRGGRAPQGGTVRRVTV